MNINFSVLIWTMINFFILLLVLDRFLFRPLISFMRKRDARIEESLTAAEHARARLEEGERQAAERLAESRRAGAKRIQASVEDHRARNEQAFTEEMEETQSIREDKIASILADQSVIVETLDSHIPAFLSILTENVRNQYADVPEWSTLTGSASIGTPPAAQSGNGGASSSEHTDKSRRENARPANKKSGSRPEGGEHPALSDRHEIKSVLDSPISEFISILGDNMRSYFESVKASDFPAAAEPGQAGEPAEPEEQPQPAAEQPAANSRPPAEPPSEQPFQKDQAFTQETEHLRAVLGEEMFPAVADRGDMKAVLESHLPKFIDILKDNLHNQYVTGEK